MEKMMRIAMATPWRCQASIMANLKPDSIIL